MSRQQLCGRHALPPVVPCVLLDDDRFGFWLNGREAGVAARGTHARKHTHLRPAMAVH